MYNRAWIGTRYGLSVFDGSNWRSVKIADGLSDDFIYSISFDRDNNAWIGTYAGVTMLPIDFISQVQIEDENILPVSYELFQNYPNPFNSLTTILYYIDKSTDITLKVFNTLGQEVRTLFIGRITKGRNEIIWDGMNASRRPLSSGVYIYRLTTSDGFSDSKKMLLLR